MDMQLIMEADYDSMCQRVVELFRRIAARWELLFETVVTQLVVSPDEEALTAYVKKVTARF